jgi:hypothetical protein
MAGRDRAELVPCRARGVELYISLSISNNLIFMGNLRISEWRKLPVSLAELCIDTTLRCGQSFRWKKLRDDEW